MTEESKEADPVANVEALEEALTDHDSEGEEAGASTDKPAEGASKKKKKGKKSKLKKALGVSSSEDGSSAKPAQKLTDEMVEQLLEMNPSLKAEIAGMDKKTATEALKNLDVADLLSGMAVGGKNKKDMASYKFWQTQPVPRFDDKILGEEGPMQIVDKDKVPKEPSPLLDGFEWVTLDIEDPKELEEMYELLNGHYVEDDSAMFRFRYSVPFLNWYACLFRSQKIKYR